MSLSYYAVSIESLALSHPPTHTHASETPIHHDARACPFFPLSRRKIKDPKDMAKGRKRPASDMDDRSISVQESVATTADCRTRSGTGAPPSAAVAALAGDASNNNNNNNEVRFGKHLASSDKKVRDRTVLALREWLQRRSKGGALTDLDLLKVRTGSTRLSNHETFA